MLDRLKHVYDTLNRKKRDLMAAGALFAVALAGCGSPGTSDFEFAVECPTGTTLAEPTILLGETDQERKLEVRCENADGELSPPTSIEIATGDRVGPTIVNTSKEPGEPNLSVNVRYQNGRGLSAEGQNPTVQDYGDGTLLFQGILGIEVVEYGS